jgi:hypothetical protein
MMTSAGTEATAPAGAGAPANSPDVLARLRDWETKAEEVGRETVEARLDAWRARIEALRIQVHLAGLDARDQGAPTIARLETRLDHAADRLRELAMESRDVWVALAETFESARGELVAGERLVSERVKKQ